MLSAQEARELDPANAVNKWMVCLEKRIKDAAELGKTFVRFPYELTEVRGEGSVSPKGVVGAKVIKELESLGYTINDHWDCGQFVDAYLTIDWSE